MPQCNIPHVTCVSISVELPVLNKQQECQRGSWLPTFQVNNRMLSLPPSPSSTKFVNAISNMEMWSYFCTWSPVDLGSTCRPDTLLLATLLQANTLGHNWAFQKNLRQTWRQPIQRYHWGLALSIVLLQEERSEKQNLEYFNIFSLHLKHPSTHKHEDIRNRIRNITSWSSYILLLLFRFETVLAGMGQRQWVREWQKCISHT